MENRFCIECGNELKNNSSFCSNCGAKVGEIKTSVPTQTSSADTPEKGKIFGILSLVFFFIGIIINAIAISTYTTSSTSSFLDHIAVYRIATTFAELFGLAGIVLMIVGRVKYRKNKLLKVAMWIIISVCSAVVLFVIFGILVLIFAFSMAA